MNQFSMIFFYVLKLYFYGISLCTTSFWGDFNEVKVQNFNFKQTCLFFQKNVCPIFKHVFYGEICVILPNFTVIRFVKGWIFRKLRLEFCTIYGFQYIGHERWPIFWRFFDISRVTGQPGANQFSQDFCQRCTLPVSTFMPSFTSISWTEGY